MKKNINVEVNSIRLEENTETPIMLLLDPNSQKVLPIWIGTCLLYTSPSPRDED